MSIVGILKIMEVQEDDMKVHEETVLSPTLFLSNPKSSLMDPKT